MSGSKDCHDTEQHQNANPVRSGLTARVSAGLAFIVFFVTVAACGSSRPAPAVPIKAMDAVFYEKPESPLADVPPKPAPPKPVAPAPPVSPVLPAPSPPAKPPVPTWTPTPTQTPRHTDAYTAPPVSVRMPRSAVQAYARSLVGSSYEFTCLAHIVDRESGWNPQATNRSGAFGVPQALPGEKMSSAGSDWRTNPQTQIRWMVGYLHSRYGSACSAWSFWQSHGWY